MFGSSRTWSGTLDGADLDLDELRSQALTYLTIAMAGSAWLLNLAMPPLTGSTDAAESFFLASLWLMAAAVLGWIIRRYSVTLAGIAIAGVTTVLIAVTALQAPSGLVLSFLALVVVAVMAVAGPYYGFGWAIACSLIAILIHGPTGPIDREVTLVTLVLIWGSAFAAWLGFRPVYAVAEWAWSNYQESVRLSQEVRIRQAELAGLVKSLTEAYDRLENRMLLFSAHSTRRTARAN